MYAIERPKIKQDPSFSSTLLDEIFRSIDETDKVKHDDYRYYHPTTTRKPVKKQNIYQKQQENTLFFSSTSTSSDSSYGGSSDTESFKSRSCSLLPPQRPKPIKTTVERKSRLSELRLIDDFHYNSAPEQTPRFEEATIKSKSRASKLYSKVKQPLSPGGKIANFINSLFTNKKNPKKSDSSFEKQKPKLLPRTESSTPSVCSSASSFSRSCLSKKSEKLQNGVKRNVRFVDEEAKPCRRECLYREETRTTRSSLMSLTLPSEWKIGKSPSRKLVEDDYISEKSKRIEKMARDFLKEYHQNQKKSGFLTSLSKHIRDNYNVNNHGFEDDDDDDDAASCSSSDLFELDVIRNSRRYCEELPVYETTRIDSNVAIANRLLM